MLWLLLLAPACLYLLVVFLAPLANTLLQSFEDGRGAGNYSRAILSETYRSILWTTVRLALETTAFCALVAYPIAFVFAHARRRVLLVLISMVMVPFWISVLIRSYAWIILLRDNGVINNALRSLGIIQQPLHLVYNETGVIVGMVYTMLPYMILTILTGLGRIDKRLVPAARGLGASATYAFRRVYFPLSLPGISAGMTLVFIHAIGFYVTPALLSGGRVTTIAMVIETQMLQVMDWGFAAALSVVLLGTVLAMTAAWFALTEQGSVGRWWQKGSAMVRALRRGTGKGEMPKQPISPLEIFARQSTALKGPASHKTFSRPPTLYGWVSVRVVAALGLLFLIFPIFVIVGLSFDGSNVFRFPPAQLSLRWYKEFFVGDLWLSSASLSFRVGLVVACLSTVLGGFAAIGLQRVRLKGKAILAGFLLAPMIVPTIVTAFALYSAFLKFNLVGTFLGLVLAHTALAMPPVILLIGAALRRVDDRLESAALTLGASRWYAWKRVLIPQILPGLSAAWLFAFLTSFDEVVVAIFLSDAFNPTLPKRIWDSVRLDIEPTVSAVAALLILGVSLLTLVGVYLERKAGVDKIT